VQREGGQRKVRKLERVAVFVRDIEEAKRFWGDLLETGFNTVNVTQSTGATDIAALSQLGFELVEFVSPPSQLDGGFAVIFRVDNLQELIVDMKKKGFEPETRIDIDNLEEAVYVIRGVTLVFAEHTGRNFGLRERRNKNKDGKRTR
jgi:catechol 2,3-dioxygenase-like lactoylglutathione lyase family enzyme